MPPTQPSTIEIRPAAAEDASACQQIVAAVFAEYGMSLDLAGWDRDLTEPHQAYAPPGAICLVATVDGGVAGLVAGHLEETYAELHRLYIDPWARGRGIGRLLCLAIEKWAAPGQRQLRLWSDVRFIHAHRLYRQLGYRLIGSRILEDLDRSVEFGFQRDTACPPGPTVFKMAVELLDAIHLRSAGSIEADANLWHKARHTAAAILDCRTLDRGGSIHQLPHPTEIFALPPAGYQVVLADPQTIIGFKALYSDGTVQVVLHPSCDQTEILMSGIAVCHPA